MAGMLTNYPAGFGRFPQTEQGQSRLQTHSGSVFWVSNSTAITRNQSPGSDSGKGDFNHPFATLNYALTQCVAGRGDIVFVKPGHAESLTGAGAITQSVDGCSVVGIGNYTNKPKFTFGPLTATTWLVSGANCFVQNVSIVANLAAIVTAFNVTGKGCTLDNIRFSHTSAILDFLTCITATGASNTADGLTVTNCSWTSTTATDLSLINFAGSAADVTVWNNQMVTISTQATQFSCGNLINIQTGKILTNADIGWNRVQNLLTSGEVLISCDGTTNTGIVHNNYVQCADVTSTIDLGADVTGFGLFQNKVVTTNVLSGFLLPAADVNL